MAKTKTTPEVEEYLERARAAREEQAARREERGFRDAHSVEVLRAKFEKRRNLIRGDTERGDLRKHAVSVVAEAFDDAGIVELLALNEEGAARRAKQAAARQERGEVKALTARVERERAAEARADAEAEARRRLGVAG